jgi:hypothetical protein
VQINTHGLIQFITINYIHRSFHPHHHGHNRNCSSTNPCSIQLKHPQQKKEEPKLLPRFPKNRCRHFNQAAAQISKEQPVFLPLSPFAAAQARAT